MRIHGHLAVKGSLSLTRYSPAYQRNRKGSRAAILDEIIGEGQEGKDNGRRHGGSVGCHWIRLELMTPVLRWPNEGH